MFKQIIKNKKYCLYVGLIVITGMLLFLAFNVVQEGPKLLEIAWMWIRQFLEIVSPIIYAFIIAYLLYYPILYVEGIFLRLMHNKKLDKKKKGFIRMLSVTIVFIILISVIITAINFIIPPLVKNVNNLLSNIPQFENNVARWINDISDYMESLSINSASWSTFVKEISIVLSTLGQWIINFGAKLVGNLSSFILDFVVTVILTFYFLKDRDRLFEAIDKFGSIILPSKAKNIVKTFIKDLDDVVGKFLMGTIFDSFIVGVVSTILMLIIGHPFAILIGVVAGVTNVIPYVGPIVGAGMAFTLGIFKSLNIGVIGAILLLIYQQIDGNIVQPKIVGDKVGLAPVWILIAVLIGGSYFGGLGMIFSVPIAGLISIYIDRIYKYKRNKIKQNDSIIKSID